MSNLASVENTKQNHRSIVKMEIVHRDAIETLRSVIVAGAEHSLGIHKDFRRHSTLLEFIPEVSRLSMSWVHLDEGQVLEPHRHPVESMIVICTGHGRVIGDIEQELREGDVVTVPPGCLHGFVGAAGGFWGLSVQFDGPGLYEHEGTPRVHFESMSSPRSVDRAGFLELIAKNRGFVEQFEKGELLSFLKSAAIQDPACRARFMDSLQVWSNYFQKIMMVRSAFTEPGPHAEIFSAHFTEEFGHNHKLASDRGAHAVEVWDPILEAASNWFVTKMLSVDDAQKVVLVHLVLEAAGTAFHRIARPTMERIEETDYFAIHDDADDGHEKVGLELLRNLEPSYYDSLLALQEQGWSMFQLLSSRLAQLATLPATKVERAFNGGAG